VAVYAAIVFGLLAWRVWRARTKAAPHRPAVRAG
jgi:hypothetical protein